MTNPKIYSRLATLKKIEQWFKKRFPIYLALAIAVPIIFTILEAGE